jgi:hypothetical protein
MEIVWGRAPSPIPSGAKLRRLSHMVAKPMNLRQLVPDDFTC